MEPNLPRPLSGVIRREPIRYANRVTSHAQPDNSRVIPANRASRAIPNLGIPVSIANLTRPPPRIDLAQRRTLSEPNLWN